MIAALHAGQLPTWRMIAALYAGQLPCLCAREGTYQHNKECYVHRNWVLAIVNIESSHNKGMRNKVGVIDPHRSIPCLNLYIWIPAKYVIRLHWKRKTGDLVSLCKHMSSKFCIRFDALCSHLKLLLKSNHLTFQHRNTLNLERKVLKWRVSIFKEFWWGEVFQNIKEKILISINLVLCVWRAG
jgi:hypothetical protein